MVKLVIGETIVNVIIDNAPKLVPILNDTRIKWIRWSKRPLVWDQIDEMVQGMPSRKKIFIDSSTKI